MKLGGTDAGAFPWDASSAAMQTAIRAVDPANADVTVVKTTDATHASYEINWIGVFDVPAVTIEPRDFTGSTAVETTREIIDKIVWPTGDEGDPKPKARDGMLSLVWPDGCRSGLLATDITDEDPASEEGGDPDLQKLIHVFAKGWGHPGPWPKLCDTYLEVKIEFVLPAHYWAAEDMMGLWAFREGDYLLSLGNLSWQGSPAESNALYLKDDFDDRIVRYGQVTAVSDHSITIDVNSPIAWDSDEVQAGWDPFNASVDPRTYGSNTAMLDYLWRTRTFQRIGCFGRTVTISDWMATDLIYPRTDNPEVGSWIYLLNNGAVGSGSNPYIICKTSDANPYVISDYTTDSLGPDLVFDSRFLHWDASKRSLFGVKAVHSNFIPERMYSVEITINVKNSTIGETISIDNGLVVDEQKVLDDWRPDIYSSGIHLRTPGLLKGLTRTEGTVYRSCIWQEVNDPDYVVCDTTYNSYYQRTPTAVLASTAPHAPKVEAETTAFGIERLEIFNTQHGSLFDSRYLPKSHEYLNDLLFDYDQRFSLMPGPNFEWQLSQLDMVWGDLRLQFFVDARGHSPCWPQSQYVGRTVTNGDSRTMAGGGKSARQSPRYTNRFHDYHSLAGHARRPRPFHQLRLSRVIDDYNAASLLGKHFVG